MKMTDKLKISKLTLGTVQLGLPYGIANKKGQPDCSSSHELLKSALEKGINTLDTARNYGNAEEVIGSFAAVEQFNIVSKFKLSDVAMQDLSLAVKEAKESVKTSCQTLKLEQIPICLFHKNKDQDAEAAARILPLVLDELQNEGLINEGGISMYSPQELKAVKKWDKIRAIQVPINVFDTRLLKESRMSELMDNDVKVFARSIYLQGLITLDESSLSGALSFVKPFLVKLKSIAKTAGLGTKELAFAFVRDTPGISSLVIGAESSIQLEENINLLNTSPLPSEVYSEILKEFKAVPERVIVPALWNI